MITYREKGEGLHEEIARQGHWLGQDDSGVWRSDDDEAVQHIIDWFDPTRREVVPPSRFEAWRGKTFR